MADEYQVEIEVKDAIVSFLGHYKNVVGYGETPKAAVLDALDALKKDIEKGVDMFANPYDVIDAGSVIPLLGVKVQSCFHGELDAWQEAFDSVEAMIPRSPCCNAQVVKSGLWPHCVECEETLYASNYTEPTYVKE